MLNEICSYGYTPAVYAVGKSYTIMLPVTVSCTFWVKVGDRCFYDDSNGILRSDTAIHRVTVPMSLLDTEKQYTVFYRIILERKPYFSQLAPAQSVTFPFRPVENDTIRVYQIADAHGERTNTIAAAKHFMDTHGGLDLLVLNGDVLDHSGAIENFNVFYDIITALTHGEFPVIISRGNHDLRGVAAEKLSDYMPDMDGHSYFSFRLGKLWGLVLDCGEDKDDAGDEYGGVICCHDFRERETAYLRDVIANADREYKEDGVCYRIAFSHIPFTYQDAAPFNIEDEIYRAWTAMLNDAVHPQLLLAGHEHRLYIDRPDSKRNTRGANFPVVVGSQIAYDTHAYVGAGVVLAPDGITVTFCDGEKDILVEKL